MKEVDSIYAEKRANANKFCNRSASNQRKKKLAKMNNSRHIFCIRYKQSMHTGNTCSVPS